MALITTIQPGHWSDPETWDLGRVPEEDDHIVLDHHVTVEHDVLAAWIDANRKPIVLAAAIRRP